MLNWFIRIIKTWLWLISPDSRYGWLITVKQAAVRFPPRIFLFSCEFIRKNLFRKQDWRQSPISDGFFQSRNLEEERSCCLPKNLLEEEERSLENRSYDVTVLECGMMTSYILLRNSTTTQATWGGISTRYKFYGWKPTEMTEEQCLRPSDRESWISKREREDYRLVSSSISYIASYLV